MSVPRYIVRPQGVGSEDTLFQIEAFPPISYDVAPEDIQDIPIPTLVYRREVYVIYGREYEIFKLTEFPPGTEIEENAPEELVGSHSAYFNRRTNRMEYETHETWSDYGPVQMVERSMQQIPRQVFEQIRQEAVARVEAEVRMTAQQIFYQESSRDSAKKNCRTCGYSEDGECILVDVLEKQCLTSAYSRWWDKEKGLKIKYKKVKKEKIRFIRLEEDDETDIL